MAEHDINYLERLPHELWIEICATLARQGVAAALASLSTTCRFFHCISQPLISKDVLISEGCRPHPAEEDIDIDDEPWPSSPHTDGFVASNYAQATVSSLTISCPCDNVPQCRAGSTYFPPQVGDIIPKLINVRQLTFHRTVVLEAQFLKLPLLTELVIHGGGIPEQEFFTLHSIDAPRPVQCRLKSVTLRHPIGGSPNDWMKFFGHICTSSLRSYRAIRTGRPITQDESFLWSSLAQALIPNTLETFHVTRVRPKDGYLFHAILHKQQNITDLCIGPSLSDIHVPATLVPRLRRLAVPGRLLRAFMLDRPISHVTVTDDFSSPEEEAGIPLAFKSLKPSSNVIRSLRLSLHRLKTETLTPVVENLPLLERLTILVHSELDKQFLETGFCSLLANLPRCTVLVLDRGFSLALDPSWRTVEWQREILDVWTRRIPGLLRAELFGRIWVRTGRDGWRDWAEEHVVL